MISLDYSKIETYLDNVSLTKQSRIEYTKECRDIIDVIKITVMLGYKANGDVGSALKSIKLTKFKKSTLEYSSSIYTNELKTFLMHLTEDIIDIFHRELDYRNFNNILIED